MTREEQLACLKDRPCSVCKFHTNGCSQWTCIFEDEPEEQESCEDCISRQATVERLCKVAEFMNEKHNGLGSPYVMAALFIQDNKDEFPSVTPKPKTDVLDKIKAEIEEQVLESLSDGGDDWFAAEKVNECLEIIDKYKAESEETDI